MVHKLKDGGREALDDFAQGLAGARRPAIRTGRKRTPSRDMAAEILKRQTVRRKELRRLIPLSDTTIYELEKKGEFPKRFYLTPRCVVWPLAEVLSWVDERRSACESGDVELARFPDVHLRGPRA